MDEITKPEVAFQTIEGGFRDEEFYLDPGNTFAPVQLTATLVEIGSESSGEHQLAKAIHDWLRNQGIDVYLIHHDGYAPSVIAIVGTGQVAQAPLVFNAHLDTVSLENFSGVPEYEYPDSSQKALTPVIDPKADRLYGRGTVDTKGSMAAMLITALKLKETGYTGRAIFLFTPNEERGAPGIRWALEKGMKDYFDTPGAMVIAEPSNLEVYLGSGGMYKVAIKLPNVLEGAIPDILAELPSDEEIDILMSHLPAVDKAIIALLIIKKQGFSINSLSLYETKHKLGRQPELKLSLNVPEQYVRVISSIFHQCTDNIAGYRNGDITVTFKSSYESTGHAAYALYLENVLNILQRILLEPSEIMNALQQDKGLGELISTIAVVMSYRAKVKLNLDLVDKLFPTLPNLEFSHLGPDALVIDCRTSSKIGNAVVQAFFKDTILKIWGLDDFDSNVSVLSKPFRDAALTSLENPFVNIAKTVIEHLGYPGKSIGRNILGAQYGASDAQIVMDYCRSVGIPQIPFIVLGAGSGTIDPVNVRQFISTSHKPDEYVSISQLQALPDIYYSIALEYLNLVGQK